MATETASIKFEDGTELFAAWCNTIDCLQNNLFETEDEAYAAGRGAPPNTICDCENGGELATAQVDHGVGGIGDPFTTKACKHHRIIVDFRFEDSYLESLEEPSEGF